MTSRIGERARFHSLALILWCLFLVAGLAIVDDYGVSWDTMYQRLLPINTLNYVLHDNPTLLRTHDRFYGAAFELPLLLLTERILGLEDPRHVHLARHVLTHLWFLIGGFCCYLLAWRLSGDRLAALLVMLLFLLSPRLYAHSFFNSKDAAFASVFVMALLLASRAFDKDSVRAYRWCGAAAGLLVNLRIMGVVLLAVVLVFRLWAWLRAEGAAARRGRRGRARHGGGLPSCASASCSQPASRCPWSSLFCCGPAPTMAGGIFISCTGLFACWRPSP